MFGAQWKSCWTGLVLGSLLVGCVVKPEEEKKDKSPNQELEELTSIYGSFEAEAFDNVPQDQLAEGVKWYPDAEQRPVSPILDQPSLESLRVDQAEPAEQKSHKPFIVTIYDSDGPQTITFYYTLDKSQDDGWKELYDVHSVYAKKVSFFMDYQDHNLFGFDYYLLPELLKLEITWNEDNKAEVFIDPLVQKSQLTLKGYENLGVVTKGIDDNRMLLIKNKSAAVYDVKVSYMDERLGEESEKVVRIPINSSRLVQLPRFMKIEKLMVEVPDKNISEEVAPDSLFAAKDEIACLRLDFVDDKAKITPDKTAGFSACYEEGKTYDDWIIEKIPELVETEDDDGKPEIPNFKFDE